MDELLTISFDYLLSGIEIIIQYPLSCFFIVLNVNNEVAILASSITLIILLITALIVGVCVFLMKKRKRKVRQSHMNLLLR